MKINELVHIMQFENNNKAFLSKKICFEEISHVIFVYYYKILLNKNVSYEN